MNFNKHYRLEGQHAFLSPSRYHWTSYDEDKMIIAYSKFMASQRGVALHDFAAQAIKLGVRLARNNRTLNLFVNDAIGFKMEVEQPLYYSENCFGTADAICFRNNTLRIHDLKTGGHPASIRQLEVYAALFCLEYDYRPEEIGIELRLYQNDAFIVHSPEPQVIRLIMDKIIFFDKRLTKLKNGE